MKPATKDLIEQFLSGIADDYCLKNYYENFNFTPVINVVIAPPRFILLPQNRPYIYISFDFEDQWKKRNDNFSDVMFDIMSEAFAPTEWDAMLIRKKNVQRKEQKLKERIVTTHFYELISRS